MTQCDRVLKVLEDAKGEWVNFQKFFREMMITQAHSRIFELRRKGHHIQASDFADEYGFKSYRLLKEPKQEKLL